MPQYPEMFDNKFIEDKLAGLCEDATRQYGVPMVVKGTRHKHYINDLGQAVYELWADLEQDPKLKQTASSQTPSTGETSSGV